MRLPPEDGPSFIQRRSFGIAVAPASHRSILTQLALIWQGFFENFYKKLLLQLLVNSFFGQREDLNNMIRTVIIGAGVISHSHARAIHNLGIDIAGILDLDQGRAQELASQYGSRAIGTLDDVIEEEVCLLNYTEGTQKKLEERI